MRINQNVGAFNAYRNLSVSQGSLNKSLEKLSSGFRINRAADDAAGLVISEGLRSQIGGLKTATRNAQDGVSVVQTAEGALTEVHSMLQRMRDLTVQASSTGSYDSTAIAAAQDEVDQLAEEITRITGNTRFGDQVLFDGTFAGTGGSAATAGTSAFTWAAGTDTEARTFTVNVDGTDYTAAVQDNTTSADLETALSTALGANATVSRSGNDFTITSATTGASSSVSTTVSAGDGTNDGAISSLVETAGAAEVEPTAGGAIFQVGSDSGDTISVYIDSLDAASLSVDALDLSGDAAGALDAIDAAIADVSEVRGELGAVQNRFEHTIANLQVTTENLQASESRIRDTDMAAEMVTFTRNQILQQAGTAMLAQANAVPQSVLSLLR